MTHAWSAVDCLIMPIVVGLLVAGMVGYFWLHRRAGRGR